MRTIWNDTAGFSPDSGRIITSGTSSTIGTTDFLWRSRDKGRQSLLLSHGICQLLYTVLLIAQLSSAARKNGFHISPRNDDLLVGRPRVPPLPSLFALNRRAAWELWVSSRQSWVCC